MTHVMHSMSNDLIYKTCDLIWIGLQMIWRYDENILIWFVIRDIDLNHFGKWFCDLDLWFDLSITDCTSPSKMETKVETKHAASCAIWPPPDKLWKGQIACRSIWDEALAPK